MSKTAAARRKQQPKASALDPHQTAWDDAIATIAGGFAHDANNCLTGIFSMSDLCLAQVEPQSPLHEPLSLMRDSASQASQLLQRLTRLIYDRPGTRTYYDLNELTSETTDILRRVLGRSLNLQLNLHSEPLPVFVDAVELRQILIFLALNACEAIRDAGNIVISTHFAQTPVKAACIWGNPPTPPFVSVRVADSARLFSAEDIQMLSRQISGSKSPPAEKWMQRLLLVHRFAEKHDGVLALDSVGERGSTVQLCLPLANLA